MNDLALQLVTAGLLAVIVWGFSELAAKNIPTWVLVVGAALSTLTLAYTAGTILIADLKLEPRPRWLNCRARMTP